MNRQFKTGKLSKVDITSFERMAINDLKKEVQMIEKRMREQDDTIITLCKVSQHNSRGIGLCLLTIVGLTTTYLLNQIPDGFIGVFANSIRVGYNTLIGG